MNISKKRRELAKKQPTTLYQLAAKKFDCSYNYVSQIACGARTPTKKKGLDVKEYLENEIAKMELINAGQNL